MKKVHFILTVFILSGLFFSCKQKKIISDAPQYQISKTKIEYSRISQTTQNVDSSILKLVSPYRDSMATEMNTVIGFNDQNLNKTRPNSNLGNWMTDVLIEEGEILFNKEIDLAVHNYGGIRIPTLSKGEITKSDIFELMPFDNTLVLLEIPGDVLKVFCDKIALYGGWPISGLKFTIVGEHAEDIMINGESLLFEKTYYLAIPDFVANGGDNCDFLKPLKRENSGVFIRNVLIEHLLKKQERGESVIVIPEERIKTN